MDDMGDLAIELIALRAIEPGKELANIARIVRANGQQIVLWSRAIEAPGEKPRYPEGPTPCIDKIGRLRMTRVRPGRLIS